MLRNCGVPPGLGVQCRPVVGGHSLIPLQWLLIWPPHQSRWSNWGTSIIIIFKSSLLLKKQLYNWMSTFFSWSFSGYDTASVRKLMQVQYLTDALLFYVYLFSALVIFFIYSYTVSSFLFKIVHTELCKILIYVVSCAFIPLLVFLHGCVQCVYRPSMWQPHLPLGCSICICHHGPHHLQSQVLPPTVSSLSVADFETSIIFRFKCAVPQRTVLCYVLYAHLQWYYLKPLYSLPLLFWQRHVAVS